MPYYQYYSFSYFFFFFFFFLFILILFSYPGYTKRIIIPGLSDKSYDIKLDESLLTLNPDTNKIIFQDLKITEDGNTEDGNTEDVTVSYVPEYEESTKRFLGFYCLTLVTKEPYSFAFRIVDKNKTGIQQENTLGKYNYGWSSLTTVISTKPKHYSVKIPFLLPSNHDGMNLTVQISCSNNINNNVFLYSADLYYISY